MHDGSETTEDSMILEVTLVAGAGYTLPGYLQGRLRFPLHVNVTPVNDPPLLEISNAKVLRLAQVRHRNTIGCPVALRIFLFHLGTHRILGT